MKSLDLKCGFYVVTSKCNWGRHTELPQAFKAAGIKCEEKKIKYYVTVFLFKKETTEEQVKEILWCYCVDDRGAIVRCEGLSKKDEAQITEFIEGYTYYNNGNLIVK